MPIKSHFIAGGTAGDHKIAYLDWGDINNPNVVICVHGLTRNSRDFDDISNALSDDYRVVCMDVAGRGNSDWLDDPRDYGYPQYLNDTQSLIKHLNIDNLDWIGTSMGGILGMLLAALPNTPIRNLIINDIGPFVPNSALQRISEYLGKAPDLATIRDVEQYLRKVHAPFGPLNDQQWSHLASNSARKEPEGGYILNYDPAIADAFNAIGDQDIDLWGVWDSISCPILILRGETSDVLPLEIARQAQSRGPKTDLVQFKNIGHAPALMAEDQIHCVRQWLRR
jgi:pimeloyl-ACP methyl ester carboxylesterase